MATIEQFTDLEAWQEGHKLVLEIYKITKNFPKEEMFGIISQIRRSASSITANIAEGFGRFHYKDKQNFFYHARGSACETENFLVLAKDLGFLKEEDFDRVYMRLKSVERLLKGMIRSIEKVRMQ